MCLSFIKLISTPYLRLTIMIYFYIWVYVVVKIRLENDFFTSNLLFISNSEKFIFKDFVYYNVKFWRNKNLKLIMLMSTFYCFVLSSVHYVQFRTLIWYYHNPFLKKKSCNDSFSTDYRTLARISPSRKIFKTDHFNFW